MALNKDLITPHITVLTLKELRLALAGLAEILRLDGDRFNETPEQTEFLRRLNNATDAVVEAIKLVAAYIPQNPNV